MLHPIQTLYCTTELGSERPIHRCGHPMSRGKVRRGKQVWQCQRVSCLPPGQHELRRKWRREKYANDPEYRERERARTRDPEYRERKNERDREKYATDHEYRERRLRNNERRFFVGGMYLGMGGFTDREREEILNGSTD